MTNEEREDLNTFRHDLIKRARWWQWKAETLEKENEQLKAENAELRERLEKAVELSAKIGDTVYKVYDKCDGRNCPYNGYYGQWRCSYEGKQRCKPFIDVKSFCYDDIPRINKTVFVSKEAAEKRLAELGGEK